MLLRLLISRLPTLIAWSAILCGTSMLFCQTTPVSGATAQPGPPATASPQFEVASIRPSKDHRPLGPLDLALLHAIGEHPSNGRFQINSVPPIVLIELAYDVRDFQIKDLPDWANAAEYDIDARAEADQTLEQMRPMLQSLLAERFGLKFHPDSTQETVLDLKIAKGGLKITAAAAGSCMTLDPDKPLATPIPGRGPIPLHICGATRSTLRADHSKQMEAVGITMPALAKMLSDEVGQMVVDTTSLAGTYDIRLEFTPSGGNTMPISGGDDAAPSAPSIFTALQEQIGLRLQPARHPVDILRIEQITKPTEN